MRIIFFTIEVMLILQFASCNDKEVNSQSIETIDIEANMKNMEQIKISQFTNNIRYLPMGKKDDLFFVGIWDCVFSDKYFLAKDLTKCLLYDYEGNVVTNIGKRGRGPGEYRYVNNVAFGTNKIIMKSYFDLLEYNLEGSFIKKHENYFRINNYQIGKWLPINDSLIFGKIESSIGNEKTKALVLNLNGKIISEYKNYILFEREKALSSEWERHANIYPFSGNIFFKELHNDTLFYLSEQLRLIPEYVINLGKYTPPISLRKLLPPIPENPYMSVSNIFQTSDYLFLDTNFGIHFPAKRLTQKVAPIPIPNPEKYGWYNTLSMLGIYNKQTKSLIFCEPTSTDNPLFTSGLYNDIDGGPRFFPKEMVNDSTMAMWIEVKQLKDHIASDDFKRSAPKFPEKKKQFEEFVNKLDDFDNPVLMFITVDK
jgi:hypothetical protein